MAIDRYYFIRPFLKDGIPVPGDPVEFTYRNWRGTVGKRHVIPSWLHFGRCEQHAGAQWLLEAFDLDKQAGRTFAVADILEWRSEGLLRPLCTMAVRLAETTHLVEANDQLRARLHPAGDVSDIHF